MFNRDGFCLSYLILVFSIFICSGFAFWLYQDSDVDQYREFARVYKRLRLNVQYEEAEKLLFETQAKIIDKEKLDETWLPLVKTIPDKQVRVQLYTRILMTNPEREEAYEQMSFVIDEIYSDNELHNEEKNRYLNGLKAIAGINYVLLIKYNLIIN